MYSIFISVLRLSVPQTLETITLATTSLERAIQKFSELFMNELRDNIGFEKTFASFSAIFKQ